MGGPGSQPSSLLRPLRPSMLSSSPSTSPPAPLRALIHWVTSLSPSVLGGIARASHFTAEDLRAHLYAGSDNPVSQGVVVGSTLSETRV